MKGNKMSIRQSKRYFHWPPRYAIWLITYLDLPFGLTTQACHVYCLPRSVIWTQHQTLPFFIDHLKLPFGGEYLCSPGILWSRWYLEYISGARVGWGCFPVLLFWDLESTLIPGLWINLSGQFERHENWTWLYFAVLKHQPYIGMKTLTCCHQI